MNRAVSTFCDNCYFPILVPFLNSIFYNDVQARIKVYDHSGLNHLLRTYLRKFVDVIELSDKSIRDRTWMTGCKFRPVMLSQLGFDDAELFLDSDMVVLCDLEWPLQLIEYGKFVCSSEWVWGPGKIDPAAAERWKTITGVYPPATFDVYNGGLLGFNHAAHYDLARKWATICSDYIYHTEPFKNDQMVISGLLKSLDVDRRSLSRRYWMTTWQRHAKPPKVLGFNKSGKIRLYDAMSGKPIQVYHYTGGIVKNVRGDDKVIRYYHARGESMLDPPELAGEFMEAWKEIWREYKSPAGMIAEYMRDAGPVQVPKVFSVDFRNRAALLLRTTSEKRIYALCLAYDYITLLGYRLGGPCWLEAPLQSLLGEMIHKGDKVLRWGYALEGADLALCFGKPDGAGDWTGDAFSKPGHFSGRVIQSEYLRGVGIRFT